MFFLDIAVVSRGGAKIFEVLDLLKSELETRTVFVVVFHIGTNDVNKVYYPETQQLVKAKYDLDFLFIELRKLQVVFNFAVVFSGCIYTKSKVINKRIDLLNEHIMLCCKQSKYHFIGHSNISEVCLKDQVHLNKSGEYLYKENLRGLL